MIDDAAAHQRSRSSVTLNETLADDIFVCMKQIFVRPSTVDITDSGDAHDRFRSTKSVFLTLLIMFKVVMLLFSVFNECSSAHVFFVWCK